MTRLCSVTQGSKHWEPIVKQEGIEVPNMSDVEPFNKKKRCYGYTLKNEADFIARQTNVLYNQVAESSTASGLVQIR